MELKERIKLKFLKNGEEMPKMEEMRRPEPPKPVSYIAARTSDYLLRDKRKTERVP